MAERRPPGFNVDLDFYESDEVLSIPRRLRAAAIGVWTLCGSYSAKKLSDGYVTAEKLKQFGCTPVIQAALMATTKADGTPSPLWLDAGDGAIQFDKWSKWQRTQAEVKAYRDREAERKRNSRNGIRDGSTSDDTKMSGRTKTGRSTRDGDPSTEYREQRTTSGHLTESATDSNARDAVAATPAADLVRRVIPRDTPAPTQTGLRIAASELLNTGTPSSVVEQALRDWAVKTGVGPGVLASLAADVLKRRNGSPAPFGGSQPFGTTQTAGAPPPMGRASAKSQGILDAGARLAARFAEPDQPGIEA